MEITWYGLSCFRLTERGCAAIVTDPYGDSLGYQPLKLRADIVTVSHDAPGHNNLKAVRGVQRVITAPGEYEIGGVFVIGVAMVKARKQEEDVVRNVAYLFDFDGLTVLHLGDLSYAPIQSEVDKLGTVDVVLVPVGGGGGLKRCQSRRGHQSSRAKHCGAYALQDSQAQPGAGDSQQVSEGNGGDQTPGRGYAEGKPQEPARTDAGGVAEA